MPFQAGQPADWQPSQTPSCLAEELARCADLRTQEEAEQEVQLSLIQSLQRAARVLYWFTQPSPLEAIPFRGEPQELFARAAIAPATAPGDADGLTGIQEVAAAEAVISGTAIPVLTPATTDDFVTLVQFAVPSGRAMVAKLAGSWGHDFLAVRDVIRYRIRAAGRVISGDREMGLIGGLDNPIAIQHVLYENQVLSFEARNLDVRAGSLLEVRITGWTFPVLSGGTDTLQGLLDPDRGPLDQARFSPDPFGQGC